MNNFFKIFRKIIFQVRAYWVQIIAFFFLNLISAPIALLKPYALKVLIDSGFGSEPLPGFIGFFIPGDAVVSFGNIVLISALLIIIIALIENLHGVIAWVLETTAGEKLVLDFRVILFNHIQRLSLKYHDTKGISDSLYRIQWDTMKIRAFLLGQISPLAASIITLISMVIVMFLINWHFALISLCVIPPLFFLIRQSTRRLNRDWKKVKEDESHAMSVLHEVLNSIRVVKAFGQEENEEKRFINRADEAIKGQIKVAWSISVFNLIVGLIFAVATALFIYLGAYYVKEGSMTLGELTLVIAYLAQVFGPLQSISKNLNEIQSSLASIERVTTLLEHEKEVKEDPHAIHLNRVEGNFEFRNVSFQYDNGRDVLKDVSFSINAGDKVGIIGSTGAGKSTLISLINRFYDPVSGSIHLDGTDIRKFRLAEYRNQFAIVLQEPVLFSTTIEENIRYGKMNATEEEIHVAAKAANAYNFIISSKDGFNTMVGERGMQLSGGERQRISLARAFIKNSPLLILDEPTSSVDINTEKQIMDAMSRLMEGRTTFMISHRLETLDNCDVIIFLENGMVKDFFRNDNSSLLRERTRMLFQKAI